MPRAVETTCEKSPPPSPDRIALPESPTEDPRLPETTHTADERHEMRRLSESGTFTSNPRSLVRSWSLEAVSGIRTEIWPGREYARQAAEREYISTNDVSPRHRTRRHHGDTRLVEGLDQRSVVSDARFHVSVPRRDSTGDRSQNTSASTWNHDFPSPPARRETLAPNPFAAANPVLISKIATQSPAYHQTLDDGRKTPPLDVPATVDENDAASTVHRKVLESSKTQIDALKLECFATSTRRDDDTAPKTAALNIAALQRYLLAELRKEIAEWTADAYMGTPYPMRDLERSMSRYCRAVQDLEYMTKAAAGKDDDDDLFYMKSSRQIDRLTMEAAGLIPDHVLPQGPLPIARDRDNPQLPGAPRSVASKAAKREQLLLRFTMASVGGLFVVVPIVIMAFANGRIASLVTTCVAMLLFAVGITVGTELKADQVLAATAAYAAVLVVFVGTSLSPGP